MTITQTVEITEDRRITIPREVPTGATIITFTPTCSAKNKLTAEEEREYINQNAERLNKEAMDVLSYQWPGFNEEKLREMEAINRQAAGLNKGLNA